MKGQPFHYFATGMNGDDDLGEDIIMKGKPFHYFATGMNGDEDLGQNVINGSSIPISLSPNLYVLCVVAGSSRNFKIASADK